MLRRERGPSCPRPPSTTVTDPAHLETARRLRHEFRQHRQQPGSSDLFRDLADYDRAFGLSAADEIA